MVSQEDIDKTLIFLDNIDYPPTAMEIWRFLGVRAELGEVISFLSQECHPRESGDPVLEPRALDSRLRGNDTGFYFLPGRDELVEKRREFDFLSEKKFKIAKRAARILRFIPSVKMVAVCNNFYYSEQSDIDFLIITAAHRLWLTRFFATLLLDFSRLRARGRKTADKICLSFYISDDHLDLEDITLPEEPDSSSRSLGTPWPDRQDDKSSKDDPCLATWLAFMEPIYGLDIYEKFWQANNRADGWFKKIFPSAEAKRPVPNRLVNDSLFSMVIKNIGRLFFSYDWLENLVAKIQRWKLSPEVKELAAQDNSNVVLDERMLKFHENDDRENFREKIKNCYSNYMFYGNGNENDRKTVNNN
jgi:hypothetical protein